MCAGTQTERTAQAERAGPLSSLRPGGEAAHKAAENASCKSAEQRWETTQPGGNTAFGIICLLSGACVSKAADIGNLIKEDVQTPMFPVLQHELEEKKRSESLQNVPEFVRVRGTLRRTQTFS